MFFASTSVVCCHGVSSGRSRDADPCGDGVQGASSISGLCCVTVTRRTVSGGVGRADLFEPGPARRLLLSSDPRGAGMALCQKATKGEVGALSMTSYFSNVWPTST